MKETYKESILNHWKEAIDATRTVIYKAAAAYIYGDAWRFQQDCVFDSELDGKHGEGQNLAMELADVCLEVMNADTIHVPDYCESLAAHVKALVKFLGCSDEEFDAIKEQHDAYMAELDAELEEKFGIIA